MGMSLSTLGKERQNGFLRGGARGAGANGKEGQLVVPFSLLRHDPSQSGRGGSGPGYRHSGPARPRKRAQNAHGAQKNNWKSLAAQKGGKNPQSSISQIDTQDTHKRDGEASARETEGVEPQLKSHTNNRRRESKSAFLSRPQSSVHRNHRRLPLSLFFSAPAQKKHGQHARQGRERLRKGVFLSCQGTTAHSTTVDKAISEGQPSSPATTAARERDCRSPDRRLRTTVFKAQDDRHKSFKSLKLPELQAPSNKAPTAPRGPTRLRWPPSAGTRRRS